MSKNNFVVMIDYDCQNNIGDIRCRSDIDISPHFIRMDKNKNAVGFIQNGVCVKFYYIVYEGPKRNAQRFAETLRMCYQALQNNKIFISGNICK